MHRSLVEKRAATGASLDPGGCTLPEAAMTLGDLSASVAMRSRGDAAQAAAANAIVWYTVAANAGVALAQFKLANALFAVQLDRLGRDAGVRAYSVNPGYILTPLQRHLAKQEMIDAGWIDEEGTALLPEFRSPDQGAATQVWAAAADASTS